MLLSLLSGVGTATASRGIALEPTGANRASGSITFEEFEEDRITCRWTFTLEDTGQGGTSKSTATVLTKVVGATATECDEGTVRMLAPSAATPWRATYITYTGTLPRISSIRFELRGIGFLISYLSGRCLYGGNVQATTVNSPITSLRFDQSINVPLVVSLVTFPPCTEEGHLFGSLALERAIIMRLV